jgi:hypothetical protein
MVLESDHSPKKIARVDQKYGVTKYFLFYNHDHDQYAATLNYGRVKEKVSEHHLPMETDIKMFDKRSSIVSTPAAVFSLSLPFTTEKMDCSFTIFMKPIRSAFL